MTNQEESRVGILVPSHNHSRYLEARIESILNQTFQDFTIYIVDDGSSDKSWDLLQSYEGNIQVKLFQNLSASGSPFSQYSRFIGGSYKHKYWWIAESDDTASTDFLMRTITVLDKDPEIKFVFSASTLINSEGISIGRTRDYLSNYFPELDWSEDQLIQSQLGLQFLLRGQFVPNLSGMLFRMDSFKSRELFNIHRFKLAGDWKFVISLQSLGKSFYVSDEINYFRTHSETARTKTDASARVSEYLYCNYYAWKKIGDSPSLDIALRSTLIMAKSEGVSLSNLFRGLFRLSPFLGASLTFDIFKSILFQPIEFAKKIHSYFLK
jgi:glycosyltransferase involved in cell wall biosynthesis